jgi:hypothetical protein
MYACLFFNSLVQSCYNQEISEKNNAKSSFFWGISPCRQLKVNWLFGGTCRLHLQGRRISQARNQLESRCFGLVSCLSYSSTLKMEGTCSSETSVDFQLSTWRYISEDRTLHIHRCENLISYINIVKIPLQASNQMWTHFYTSPMIAIHPVYPVLLESIALIMFGEG